jgi:Ca2+-binding RTX toxin-like protein
MTPSIPFVAPRAHRAHSRGRDFAITTVFAAALVAASVTFGVTAPRADAATTGGVSNETLTLTGDAASDKLALRLKPGAPGTLQMDVGDDGTADKSFSRSTFTKIVVNTGGGNDVVRIDEVNGVFTDIEATTINGQDGADSISGGAGNELLFGGAGNDAIAGFGGNDIIVGGAGNDLLHGDGGNDAFVRSAGDDSDPGIDGGPGTDTFVYNGSALADAVDVQAGATAGHVNVSDTISFPADVVAVEKLDVNTLDGADVITAGNGLADRIALDLDGGAGNDRISTGDDSDVLRGGTGNDVLNAGAAADVVVAGAGDDGISGGRDGDWLVGEAGADTFTWNAADGNDVIEGQDGSDKLVMNGSGIGETFNVRPSGSRIHVTRDIGTAALDVNGVDNMAINTFGGRDIVFAEANLPGLAALDLALEPATGNDGQDDNVSIAGTEAADSVTVKPTAVAGHVAVSYGAGRTAYDMVGENVLAVFTRGGNDLLVSSLPPSPFLTTLHLAAGAGTDVLIGSDASESLQGEDGNDLLLGRGGSDLLLGGAGDDALDGGHSNDNLEGGPGVDSFTCADAGDKIIAEPGESISAVCR